MDEIKLKRCPCCGGEAQIGNVRSFLGKGIYVKCKNCELRTEVILVDNPVLKCVGLDESTRYTEEQAVEKSAEIWNRRVDDEQRKAD